MGFGITDDFPLDPALVSAVSAVLPDLGRLIPAATYLSHVASGMNWGSATLRLTQAQARSKAASSVPLRARHASACLASIAVWTFPACA